MSDTERLSGRTILVVDDEAEIREIVAEILEMYGAKVFTAGNANIALDILRKEKIDVVMSDVRMPGGDGIYLLEESRKLPEPIPPILLMTGYSDLSEAEALKKGACKLISKPFDLNGILGFLADTVTPG